MNSRQARAVALRYLADAAEHANGHLLTPPRLPLSLPCEDFARVLAALWDEATALRRRATRAELSGDARVERSRRDRKPKHRRAA